MLVKVSLSNQENLNLSIKAVETAIVNLKKELYSELNNALIHLLEDSHREIKNLSSRTNDLVLSSLHLRNIFELNLLLLHIQTDEKALKNWYGQAYKDSKDIQDGFISLLKRKKIDSSEIENIQEFDKKNIDDSPYTSKGGFQIKTLAEKYGYLEDYSFVYKLCSKLLHPTSMKVNDYSVLTENKKYLNVVLQTGVYFSRKIEETASDINAKIA